MRKASVFSVLAVLVAGGLGVPANAGAASKSAKKTPVTVTIPAGSEASINAQEFGLPRYGLSTLDLQLTSDVSHLAPETLTVLPRGAVEEVAEPEVVTSDGLLASTGTGIGGDVTIANDGDEPVTVTVTASDWKHAERVIPADQEGQFIANAARMGTPGWMARMAVWDAELAATTAVSSTADTFKAKTTRVRRLDKGAPHSAREAVDGTCSGNYRITGWDHMARYYNWEGSELWRVYFLKRFCVNLTQRVIGSTYFRVNEPVFTALGNSSYVHVRSSDHVNRYEAWGGKAQGSHYSHRSHTLKHCAVKYVICGGDAVYHYRITGYGDGSKVPSWN